MNRNLSELAPHQVWEQFHKITQVPRPSHHEEAIRAFLLNQARTHHLEYSADDVGNVILRKPATPGMESRKGIILQAHMDMVPQKNKEKPFDFTKDAIDAYIDGDWVTADGTTLGADNGLGMAAILAVMTSDNLVHGPLEALITATEETGLDGALGLKGGLLHGEILINLDSETEGELCVGCAGGEDVTMTLPYRQLAVPTAHHALRVEVKGLKGGHSGIDIHLERGNANLILIRLLKGVSRQYGVRITAIDGGGLHNAIPREATATLVVPDGAVAAFRQAVNEYEKILKAEYKGIDEELIIQVNEAPQPDFMLDEESQQRLICAMHGCPNGVIRMSQSMKGVVQTSSNLARVVSQEGLLTIICMVRSSVSSERIDLGERIASVFELAGADITRSGMYEGWNPNMESPILKTMTASYTRLFGQVPSVQAVHAGLECGIISTNYPHLDMISFGPTIRHPHSPDEKVYIPSVQKFWDYLVDTLRNAPFKE